ncbi:MAG: GH3 auxin-responsive promoter family protein, partial [Pseudobdellovibrionaceae bacterium]
MIEKIVTAAQLPGYFRFKMALKNPEKTQRERLAQILRAVGNTQSSRKFRIDSDMNYKQFSQNIPLTDYMYWEKQILSQKLSGANLICYDVKRYQPTSGSSSAHKWIPYSQEFMSELDSATQAWLGDVGRQNPNAFRGAQYWSLSWLPQDQRADRPSNDDLELLPAWKRWFLQKVMAVPSAVTYTDTMQESQFATLAYLAARPDLSLVSVWSPTFWLTLLEQLEQWRPLLAETLNSGIWTLPGFSSPLKAPLNPRAAVILQTFSGVDLFNQLWPNLALISCWDSAGSQTWAQKIREFHPRVRVQGKGLWTTEGVVTVPFQHQYPAATTSHFFEWIDLDSGKISPTWELRKGQMVQPVLTGGHGLLRYKINDALEVTGQLGLTPTFTF